MVVDDGVKRTATFVGHCIVCRKKIADFYHRTSMSSYCTAFAYRPLVENVTKEMADVYLEVPEDTGIFQNPATSRYVAKYSLVIKKSKIDA